MSIEPDVETVPRFVAGWLALRSRDPEIGQIASELIGPLSTLLASASSGSGRTMSHQFLDRLGPRLLALVELGRRLGEGPSNSPQATWRQEANRLSDAWNPAAPDDWWPTLLELSDVGNPLVRATIIGSLDDAAQDLDRCPRPVLAALRRLREHDEAPFQGRTVPPAPGAPWEFEDYLVPPDFEKQIESLREGLAPLSALEDDSELAAAPTASKRLACFESWQALADAHAEGWPIARSRLREVLGGLRASIPQQPTRVLEVLTNGLAELESRPQTAVSDPLSKAKIAPQSNSEADPVATIGVEFLDHPVEEARAIGRRLVEAASRAGFERCRLVIGCLIAINEPKAGAGRERGWVKGVRAQLLDLARGLDGCEILEAGLTGQPVRNIAERVQVVQLDDQAPKGPSHRVTRVERPGYALKLPDGTTQVLIKARVWISP